MVKNGESKIETNYTADSITAWDDLRMLSMSGMGIEMVERLLEEMYGLSDATSSMSARDLTVQHDTLVSQIKEMPDVNLDMNLDSEGQR